MDPRQGDPTPSRPGDRMRELVRRLLRFRIVRWPFYRLVSLRNYAVAGVRWSRNLLVWFMRATYYRSLFAWNWVRFACRWLANYAAWLAQFIWCQRTV